jgi:hypothetical protein
MQSWNTIKRSLKEFSESHPLVNSFGTGNILDPDSAQITNFVTPEIDRVYYPLVFATLDGARFGSNSATFTVGLVFMDKIEESQKVADRPTGSNALNFQTLQPDEVMSDMTQLAGDFMIKYQRRFGDRVAGCRAVVSFNVPLALSVCTIPTEMDPDTCYYGGVEATNQIDLYDGNTLAVAIDKPINITFDGSAVSNLFLWFAVPSTYSFSHWYRSAFDQGSFVDLFEVYDTQDGYDIYVTKWQTEATVQMTIQ